MIRTAYMAPSERPTTFVDVKRALLTYDRVLLSDPYDRDLIPPQSFMGAVGMPFLSSNTGPVRRLGKVPNYDSTFDELIDQLRDARQQGLIDVVSSYDRQNEQGSILIGGDPIGKYPLNPEFMLWSYRSVAREQAVLECAIRGDDVILKGPDELITSIVEERATGDYELHGDPPPPLLEGALSREHLRRELTMIARSRIASTMKSIGYCAAKDMVPVFSEDCFAALASQFASRAANVIDHVASDDPYWTQRRSALKIAHDEYLNSSVLEQMELDDVLRLRTMVWGDQAEARDALLASVATLAREAAHEDNFEDAVRLKIQEYRRKAIELAQQRASLGFNIKCEVLKAAATAGASAMAGGYLNGMLSQMQTAMGAGTVLLAGCLYAVDRIQDQSAALSDLKAADSDFGDDACFGLHNFYRGAARAVGSDVQL